MPLNKQFDFLEWFLNEVLNLDLGNDFANSEALAENEALKEKIKKLEFDLATQKNLTRHYEGIAHIMTAELKKVRWVEAMSKSERLRALLSQFNNEMRGFLADKEQLLIRFGLLENLYHSIVAILKCL